MVTGRKGVPGHPTPAGREPSAKQLRNESENKRHFPTVWADLQADILATIEEPTPTDRVMIQRFVANLRLADRASAMADAEPLITGTKGQLIEHPGFRLAARAQKVALTIGRQLKVIEHPQGRPPKARAEAPRNNPARVRLSRILGGQE